MSDLDRVESPTKDLNQLIDSISGIGRHYHEQTLIKHARANAKHSSRSLKSLPKLQGAKASSGIVISAGPSTIRRDVVNRILKSGYQGTVIAVDGAYVQCLSKGLIPDFVVTLDPHPTRMVRWFGDPNFAEHSKKDDFFVRQDLDKTFRENSLSQNKHHIDLVNRFGSRSKMLMASSAPSTVVDRVIESGLDVYWWNPLVDDPQKPQSLTRELFEINKLPCVNTGGNVGSASWILATEILRIPRVALTGMDFGYYSDTPFNETQTYYELLSHLGTDANLEPYFPSYQFPVTQTSHFSDATYSWYRKNFFELFGKSKAHTVNCTEGGVLFGNSLECMRLDDFFLLTSAI